MIGTLLRASTSVLPALLIAAAAQAGVTAFKGTGGEKLFMEPAPALGNSETYVIKFDGVQSKWAGKPIKTKKASRPSGDRWSFDYEEELSSGKRTQTYQIVVDHGWELISGSRVKQVQLFYPGGDRNHPLELNQDADLTAASQKLDLAGEYKKHPFVPQVD